MNGSKTLGQTDRNIGNASSAGNGAGNYSNGMAAAGHSAVSDNGDLVAKTGASHSDLGTANEAAIGTVARPEAVASNFDSPTNQVLASRGVGVAHAGQSVTAFAKSGRAAAGTPGAVAAASAVTNAPYMVARNAAPFTRRIGLGRATSPGVATAYAVSGTDATSAARSSSFNEASASVRNNVMVVGNTAHNNSATGTTTAPETATVDSQSLDLMNAKAVALQSATNRNLVPNSLATLALPATVVLPPVRKWQYGVSYAASAFNPNINFSREGGAADFDYNPALGPDSPKLTEAAAREYSQHLESGLGHRLTLRATRRLGGRWAVSTGLELARNAATSATSASFLGEQVPDFGQVAGQPLRPTSFSYRSAGIPVELRYANPVKRGWSGYGRVGAAVSALFSVRGEVEGQPEATRTYSLRSANDAYRKVQTNLRGGAGVQFRPAVGSWAFTLGPTAEIGLLSLNGHPAQNFLHQSRAYSVGVEVGVEIGR